MPRLDTLKDLFPQANWAAIDVIIAAREPWKTRGDLAEIDRMITASPTPIPSLITTKAGAVQIGQKSDLLDLDAARNLKTIYEALRPWKKGPFNLFGTLIDSEWRSEKKWERLLPFLGSLENKVIADIGCNNGYFMFRMAEHLPKAVIGFEPFAKHWHTFRFLQTFMKNPRLVLELLGVEHVDLFPKVFDHVFCLGILYHHTDPVGILRKIHQSLKSKGHLIIDCMTIPGSEPYTLVPERRYAGMKGVWFVPTTSALINWLRRAMFCHIEVVFDEPLDSDEQRTTDWAPISSLSDFLDSDDPTRTIEGYPAPRRAYIIARKP